MDELKNLVIRAQAGDSRVYEEIYNATKGKAYYIALQLLKNPHDAEDTLQDAYITVFSKIGDAVPDKFQGWLDTIVINRAKDVLKKKKPMVFAELQSADGKDFIPEDEEERVEFIPEKNMDYQETKCLIQEIIDELPEEQRMAVMLYYYKEMPVGQIAEYFECSDGTIKSRLNYARKAIKAKVEELEKKGTKLYSIPVLPFLYWMFRSEAEEAVCTSANIFQNILESTTANQTTGKAINVTSESVAKDIAGTGAKRFLSGKVAGMSVGIKAGIAAIVATVGITGGIVIYQMATPQPKETVITHLVKKSDVSEDKQVEEEAIITPTPSPTPSPTIAPTEKPFTLDGEWNRTNVNSGQGGVMEITNLNKDGFDFHMNVANGGNVGDTNGHAVMDSESQATAKIDLYDGTFATFHFKIVDKQVEVTTENADYLGGMGTSFDGTYIKGEPTYSNEDIVEETLGDNKDNVKNLLGKDYENLTSVLKDGTSYETDLTYSGFIEGVGIGADLWIKEDGKIYCLIYEAYKGYRFYTNDSTYKNKVPEKFGQLRDEKINFICNETIN
jgi:RNA polymerase sigma factor (sigma-70 family)